MIDVAQQNLIGVKQACSLLGVNRATLVKYIKAREIKVVRRGRSWFTTPEAINDYLQRNAERELEKLENESNSGNHPSSGRTPSPRKSIRRKQSAALSPAAIRDRDELRASNYTA